jgi:hypothetical protein
MKQFGKLFASGVKACGHDFTLEQHQWQDVLSGALEAVFDRFVRSKIRRLLGQVMAFHLDAL